MVLDPGRSPTMLSPLLTQSETAKVLGISVRTLERMRVTGLGPRYVKVRSSVRYQQEALERWIEAKSRGSTSEEID
jgi:predicted DNA-binding transcriptional regulator AlpA